MIKYTYETGATSGTFEPFIVGEEEVLLTGIHLLHIDAADEIKLHVEIDWENSLLMDMGELEILLRKDSPTGEIIEWLQESCYRQAKTKFTHTRVGGEPMQTYYLSVQSVDKRARIVGPFILKGTVQST